MSAAVGDVYQIFGSISVYELIAEDDSYWKVSHRKSIDSDESIELIISRQTLIDGIEAGKLIKNESKENTPLTIDDFKLRYMNEYKSALGAQGYEVSSFTGQTHFEIELNFTKEKKRSFIGMVNNIATDLSAPRIHETDLDGCGCSDEVATKVYEGLR